MKTKTLFRSGALTAEEQARVDEGFKHTATSRSAPPYDKQNVCWLLKDDTDALVGVLTGNSLWDWLYIDELWVMEAHRGHGLGQQLMRDAEQWSRQQRLIGIWLWTQSWEAEGFYRQLGFEVFTRFHNFPRGHDRIGLRKHL
ncbi:MAG: GNAT family N-acetyltransferase [Halieaceae bacterium]|jgi:GNAT superfamily N-acetyltransferase|nr:GNAT family N-acetyltransferase [Halieaceae bacterium]